jgi:signal transduction histidine kinase
MEKGDLTARVKATSSDEIGQLAHAFNAMADGLARQEQLRRNMVSDVAHELRTPLTNIRGYLEAAKDGLVQPDGALVDNLYEEAMLLNRLVNDLQELALAEAGQLRLERHSVKVGDVVRTTVEVLCPHAEARDISLVVQVPDDLPLVKADLHRVGQVLRNLMNNALDFTPPGGQVTVTAQPDGKWVSVQVRDTGPGIAPEHLPYVFERFYRADPSRTRATGGAGLGLAIVKQLVEAHGGRVWVESTLGAGTTFGFTLPLDSS